MEPRKWVLFDIGGVLEVVDDDAWGKLFARRWQELSGFSLEEYRARLTAAELRDISRHAGIRADYWARIGQALDKDSSFAEAMEAEMWNEYCGRLNVELFDYATELRSSAGVAILSNSVDGARSEEERRFGFSAVFDPILYSHETGLLKPEPEAYENALERIGVDASDVFFIDDHEICAEGAHAVGMNAIVHRDNPTTIEAIEEFLRRTDRAEPPSFPVGSAQKIVAPFRPAVQLPADPNRPNRQPTRTAGCGIPSSSRRGSRHRRRARSHRA